MQVIKNMRRFSTVHRFPVQVGAKAGLMVGSFIWKFIVKITIGASVAGATAAVTYASFDRSPSNIEEFVIRNTPQISNQDEYRKYLRRSFLIYLGYEYSGVAKY